MVVTVIALADDIDCEDNCCLASSSSGCGRASGDESSITDRSGVRLAPADRHEQPRRGSMFERLSSVSWADL
jgi:hypothetical protein